MKKLLVIAGLLFSLASQAQVGELFCGTANVFVVDDNTGPVFAFRAFFNDAAGRWAGDSTQVGDHVFVFSGNKTYKLTVDSVLSASTIVNLRVRDSTGLLASFPTGVIALMRLTDNNQYPATIPGIPNVLGSKIATYFAEQAELAVGGSGTGVTTGVKGDINVVGADSDWQIMADSVTNASLANMPAGTIKANLTGSSANPTDATYAQIKAALGANEYCRDTITQASHGFSKAEAIYYDGSEYVSMIGLYGDSQEPHFLVIDSTTVNTFVVAACGIVNDTLGLEEGLWYSGDGGLTQNPDTVEYPIAKVFDGKTIVMSLPGFEFDATNKDLLDIVTVTGQRTLKGGQVIPMFLDSIPHIDTICGIPVTSLAEYLIALESCIPDSLARSEIPSGIDTSTHIAYYGPSGRLTGSANYTYANGAVKLIMNNIGASISASKSYFYQNTTPATVSVNQQPPMLLFEGQAWKTNATAGSLPFQGQIYFTGNTAAISPYSSFFVRGTNSSNVMTTMLNISNGASVTSQIVSMGPSVTMGSYGVGIGIGNCSVTGNNAVGVGSEVTSSGISSVVFGRYSSSTHVSSVVIGNLLFSGADNSSIFGVGYGLTDRASNNAGTGIVSQGAIPQLRVQGLPSPSTNAWTASGSDITLTTPVATLAVNQGIVLMGTTSANISYRTITAVASTTQFTVSSAPSVTSGTTIRVQTANILEVGNGANSYTQHMVIDKSGLIGMGVTPTARLHLPASTALVNTASLKIIEGTRQTTGEDGTINHVSDNLEFVSDTTPYILAKTLTNTATLDYGSIASLATETLTITVTGAAVGDVVMVGIDNASKSPGLIFGQAWVSAADTVSLEAYNSTVSPIDPASGTFRATVIKY